MLTSVTACIGVIKLKNKTTGELKEYQESFGTRKVKQEEIVEDYGQEAIDYAAFGLADDDDSDEEIIQS